MKKLLTFLLFILAFTTFANEVCHLKTFAHIYHGGKVDQVALQDFIQETTCPSEVQKKFKEIAFTFKGTLYADYLIKNFSEDLANFDVELEPSKMEVLSVEELLKKHIELPVSWGWSEIRILNQTQLLLLGAQEKLSIKCGNCQNSGSKNIEINITNSVTGATRKEWINATVVIRTKALVAKNSLAVNNQALSPNDFEIKTVESIRPERFFTDSENLPFYKLNKPIAQGTALENTDITPINLVTTTQPVQVIIKSNDMLLSGMAQALRPGKMGEMIQLRNTTSQKTILGKVIDFNKVLIEL